MMVRDSGLLFWVCPPVSDNPLHSSLSRCMIANYVIANPLWFSRKKACNDASANMATTH